MKNAFENYVSTKIDDSLSEIRNDSFLLMDSYSFDPVQQYHIMRLSKLLVKEGVRFQQRVKKTNKFLAWC